MEYRLTFPTLAIGSLAFCLSVLVTAWALDWLRRNLEQVRYGNDRNDLEPGDDGRRSSDIERGRARRGETRRAPLRRAGVMR